MPLVDRAVDPQVGAGLMRIKEGPYKVFSLTAKKYSKRKTFSWNVSLGTYDHVWSLQIMFPYELDRDLGLIVASVSPIADTCNVCHIEREKKPTHVWSMSDSLLEITDSGVTVPTSFVRMVEQRAFCLSDSYGQILEVGRFEKFLDSIFMDRSMPWWGITVDEGDHPEEVQNEYRSLLFVL